MSGGLQSYHGACRGAGLNMVEEQLDEADMVRVFRIMNGSDKIDKKSFWTMEEKRQCVGRRRFKEKEIRRTVVDQKKDARKRSFASRVQARYCQNSQKSKDVEEGLQERKTGSLT